MLDDYVSVAEAAELLGLQYHATWQRIRRRKIPILKKGAAPLVKKTDLPRIGNVNHNEHLAQAAG